MTNSDSKIALKFSAQITGNLPYNPTPQQEALIESLGRFCTQDMGSAESVFLLTGYAGTGKTSVTGALVRTLAHYKVATVLMAPTGRAAKVIQGYSNHSATTIHRRIYRSEAMEGGPWGEVAENPVAGGVFIVDEASMIGTHNENATDYTDLLSDLIYYVFSQPKNRLILIGDPAQLPPVGSIDSAALNVDRLKSYGLRVWRARLTQVVRQARKSGILYNATMLRQLLSHPDGSAPQLRFGRPFNDITAVDGSDLADTIQASYARASVADTLIITRSNARAISFNMAVRHTLLERESIIERGERLMVVKNNYLWGSRQKGIGLVANGEMVVVERIMGYEECYGLQFADVILRLEDKDAMMQCKIVLDVLESSMPSLTFEQTNRLLDMVISDRSRYPMTHISDATRRRIARTDEYVNALQVKYAYAVTCHKAQGGQWDEVYVDMGYLPPDALTDASLHRWLYTAITRARKRLYIIN